ncbi:MAG: hypothetical protein ABI557_06555 [Aureliella sp.]
MSLDFDPPANPYAPVIAQPIGLAQGSQAEQIRRTHFSHESSIQTLGGLFLLGALLLTLAGTFLIGFGLYAMTSGAPQSDSPLTMLGVGVLELTWGILQGMTGFALRKLRSGGRVGGIVFSAIGLLGFPIGTLISAYFLYLLASKKGAYIFSDEYKRVIRETPQVKLKTSIFVWILLALLLGLIGLIGIAVVGSVVWRG